jgi:hypothetical protein
MNSKSIPILLLAAAISMTATDVFAQSRGHARGGGRPGGSGGTVGHAVPRVYGPSRSYGPGRYYGSGHHVYGAPYVVGYAPYRPYYYGYRPGITVGFYAGYGYPYAYASGYYPYGYAAYGYGGYGGYGYPLPPAGYVSMSPGAAYGGVRIEGARPDAQVFADGYYVGVVDDFDGGLQHLNLEAGPHRIEVRVEGYPPVTFDVNVRPGQTITYRMP